MKKWLLAVGVTITQIFTVHCQEQFVFKSEEMASIKALWLSGHYEEVFLRGRALRLEYSVNGTKRLPDGMEMAMPALDYMIFTSMCMLPARNVAGCQLFPCLYAYHFNDGTVAALKTQQKSLCSGGPRPKPGPGLLAGLALIPTAEVQGNFKTFEYVFDGQATRPTLFPVSFPQPIKLDTSKYAAYLSRKIRKNRPYLENSIESLVANSPNKHLYRSENFLFLSGQDLERDSAQLPTIASTMEKTLQFYYSFFHFPSSDYYITVYLTNNDFSGTGFLIEKVYGIKTGEANPIGYSNFLDNAIFVCLPRDRGPGTGKHELMHLLLRRSFGNVPGWFEEGLASLYEQSTFVDDSLLGKPNWRQQYLQVTGSQPLLSLSELFADSTREKYMSETDFLDALHGNQKLARDIRQRTIRRLRKDALSRYFFLYAQQQHKLSGLFNAFKTQEDKRLEDGYTLIPNEQLVADAMGFGDVTALQYDFDRWLKMAMHHFPDTD